MNIIVFIICMTVQLYILNFEKKIYYLQYKIPNKRTFTRSVVHEFRASHGTTKFCQKFND